MDLTPYVAQLRSDLAAAADAGGSDARALADRLSAPLESSARLVILRALSDAAAAITLEMAPGSVEVRLRGLDPDFAVSLPTPEHPDEDRGPATPPPSSGPAGPASTPADPTARGDDGATSRINLRIPEPLKARVEEAAAAEGLSVNAWLVRATAAALEPAGGGVRRNSPGHTFAYTEGTRYTGWVR
ncbi:toxin-antitoxin system HicB family antitoxin [Georgenia faecalis]|uniref:toxin-antitoxin system HicB family antitoxin n=1 Tax=Georgenia faecalis TaxID=2483799 RepID=UPI000FDC100A|nr:toxin-antitoxin system HicB family antitoxin [Georgenia faecalis]